MKGVFELNDHSDLLAKLEREYARDAVRDSNSALQICEHLAVGAKHFEPRDGRLKSVSSSGKGDVWGGAWGKAWGNSWKSWLEVRLSGEAAQKYGSVIKLQDLAREAMEFWRSFTFP